MTEAQMRQNVANYLVAFIGCSEGSSKHMQLINTFNNSGLCKRYKMTSKDAWCATSVSAAFIALGYAGAPGSGKLFECVECACGNMVELAIKQGIWVENDAYNPKVGDIVLYDWDDSGKGDNTGWPDHVGIVHTAGSSQFKVIEGNKSDTVGYRTISVNAKNIRGFITPNYAKFASGAAAPAPSNPTPSTSGGYTPSKTVKFKGKVTASTLNVRDWAGENGTTVLRKLANGTVVEVCDTVKASDGNWYYIKEGGKYGFVSANYVSKVTEAAPAPSTNSGSSTKLNTTCQFKGTVTASTLNVRDWAGEDGTKVLRKLAKNTTVEVCDTIKANNGSSWYYIKEGGKYGFVSAEYISKAAAAAPATSSGAPNKTCKFKGKVTARSGLKVREWAGTENKQLRSLAYGVTVEVCDTIKAKDGSSWYYIKESGKYGFVSAEYVAKV